MIARKEHDTGARLGRALDEIRVHPWVPFALSLLLVSCVPVTDRVIPGAEDRRADAAHPDGPPVATLDPHPDFGGWTVTIRQPMRRTVTVVRTVHEEFRHVYLNPLSVPVGLISCASGLWATSFTLLTPTMNAQTRQQLSDQTTEGCLMAAMINQSRVKHRETKTLVEQREETETQPIGHGQIIVEWQGPRPVAVSYPIGAQGRTPIRLQHLETALRHAGLTLGTADRKRLEVSYWEGHRQLGRWPLEIPAVWQSSPHQEPAMLVPPRRWPAPVVVRVLVDDPSVARHRVEAQFINVFLDHEVPVVTSEDAQRLLHQEVQSNLQGQVDDATGVGPGHWLAANVLLVAGIDRTPQGITVMLTVLNVRSREVLAQVQIPAGPTQEGVAWDVALVRTAELFDSLSTGTKKDRMRERP